MKTIQKLFVIVFTLVFIAGCSDELVPVQEYNDVKNQLKVEEVDNPVIESVTGSGHISRDDYYEPDVWRTFSINAVKKADGTVKGTYQIQDHNATFVKGRVLCFTIIDNKAVLVVTLDTYRTTVPDPYQYTYGYLVVEDNGQGANSLPDRIIPLWNTESLDDCSVLKNVENDFRIVESGNIKIH